MSDLIYDYSKGAANRRLKEADEENSQLRAENALLKDERESHAPEGRNFTNWQYVALRAEVAHWKSNHDNRVEAARILIEREDLPFERVQAYHRHIELQAENALLKEVETNLTTLHNIALDEIATLKDGNKWLSAAQPNLSVVAENLALSLRVKSLKEALEYADIQFDLRGLVDKRCAKALDESDNSEITISKHDAEVLELAGAKWVDALRAIKASAGNPEEVYRLSKAALAGLEQPVDSSLYDQLEATSAMLSVLLEDIYDIASEVLKERVCKEIGNINQCLRASYASAAATETSMGQSTAKL